MAEFHSHDYWESAENCHLSEHSFISILIAVVAHIMISIKSFTASVTKYFM